jgi:hypothetical protein
MGGFGHSLQASRGAGGGTSSERGFGGEPSWFERGMGANDITGVGADFNECVLDPAERGWAE